MATILETGRTWQERLFGVFDPTDHRLVEVFGPDGYTDYNGDVLPITREYIVTGTRYSRFGDLINTIEYVDYCNGSALLTIGSGVYLNLQEA